MSEPFNINSVEINNGILFSGYDKKYELQIDIRTSKAHPDVEFYKTVVAIEPTYIIYNLLDKCQLWCKLSDSKTTKEIKEELKINSIEMKNLNFFTEPWNQTFTFKLEENGVDRPITWECCKNIAIKEITNETIRFLAQNSKLTKYVNLEKKVENNTNFSVMIEIPKDSIFILNS